VQSSFSKFIFIGGETMARTMNCRDVGPDCDFVARGETDEEVLGQVAEHARTAHGMEEVPPELAQKAKAAIKDEE
jgi:predicted small metal-binding protein